MTHPQKKLIVEVAKTMFGYTITTRVGRLHVDPDELDDLIELLSFWQEPIDLFPEPGLIVLGSDDESRNG